MRSLRSLNGSCAISSSWPGRSGRFSITASLRVPACALSMSVGRHMAEPQRRFGEAHLMFELRFVNLADDVRRQLAQPHQRMLDLIVGIETVLVIVRKTRGCSAHAKTP
jgi:hypothetical protein